MIPETVDIVSSTEEDSYVVLPSLTYKLDFVNHRIIGKVDGKNAVLQSIRKILQTDRYSSVIYDWYYGNELYTLVGMPAEYVVAELERIITEALLQDDRVLGITDLSYSQPQVDSFECTFTVKTVFGEIPIEQEVPV